MGDVTYEDLLTESQANVWNTRKANTTILSYTKNILDGVPEGLTKGTGFPYVVVATPTIESEPNLCFGGRKMSTINFEIRVYNKKESVNRLLCDAIRYCLENNLSTFKNDYGMMKYLNTSTHRSFYYQEDGSVIYEYFINVTYEVVKWL